MDLDYKELIVGCDCGDRLDHVVKFGYHTDFKDDTLYITAAINHYLPWYKRLKIAIKYLIGIDNTYHHYVETCINKEQQIKLIEFLNR